MAPSAGTRLGFGVVRIITILFWWPGGEKNTIVNKITNHTSIHLALNTSLTSLSMSMSRSSSLISYHSAVLGFRPWLSSCKRIHGLLLSTMLLKGGMLRAVCFGVWETVPTNIRKKNHTAYCVVTDAISVPSHFPPQCTRGARPRYRTAKGYGVGAQSQQHPFVYTYLAVAQVVLTSDQRTLRVTVSGGGNVHAAK